MLMSVLREGSMIRICVAMIGVLATASCGGEAERKPGTTITLQAGATGSPVNGRQASGKVAINAPGFQAHVDLPRISAGAEAFDVNGARLFPGSTLTGLSIESAKEAVSAVRVTFEAPAERSKVNDWFATQWGGQDGFTVETKANGLSGTTGDGEAFALALVQTGKERTTGTLTLSGAASSN